MKSTLFLVAVISAQVVYADLMDQLNINLASNIATCASLKGISLDQALALSNLKSPSDTPVQCFLACVAKEAGIMKTDNTFDKAAALTKIKPLVTILSVGKNVNVTEVTNKIADTCTALPTVPDKCQAAKNAFDCFIETAKKNGL